MAEHTFYCPGSAPWVAIDDVPKHILDTYPEGTREIEPSPGPGHEYDGTKWVPVEITETVPLPDLTGRQLRLGLLNIGIKPTDVTTAIEQLPSPEKERAQIEWEYANVFQRDHPLIGVLAAHFGLSKEAVDEAWKASMVL